MRITANPGETFLDRMIALVEGAQRQKTPNEITLSILLAGLTINRARQALAQSRERFMHWMDIENHDFAKVGEPELAADIERRASRLFAEIATAPAAARHDREFDQLHSRIDDLIGMNRAAMFRADSRAVKLGTS